MYCSKCGTDNGNSAKFCKQCGNGLALAQAPSQSPPVYPPPRYQMAEMMTGGYSTKISSPLYDKYQKNANMYAFIFALVLAVIAMIGFPIYGVTSGEVPMPQALYYGAGIGGMFIVISFIQMILKGKDRTWDGVVIDKYAVKKTEYDRANDHHRHFTEYGIKVRNMSGKVITNKTQDQPSFYQYYEIGDQVRHHKGLYMYEKYDKSRDTVILCNACMAFNDSKLEQCPRCKCPVLK